MSGEYLTAAEVAAILHVRRVLLRLRRWVGQEQRDYALLAKTAGTDGETIAYCLGHASEAHWTRERIDAELAKLATKKRRGG